MVTYGRDENELRDVMNELERIGGEYHGPIADSAYEDQILKVFEETKNKFGDIDILINNAVLPAMRIFFDQSYDERSIYCELTSLATLPVSAKQLK